MGKPILLCDTKGMDRERWLECRMHGPKGDIEYTVGGSDVAAIFGLSPFITPLELWRVKKGLMEPPKSRNEDQLEMGQLLEPIVAHWYGKKTGFKVIEDSGMYQHADHDYALVNIDYRFEEPSGATGVLECKTTTYHKASEWADGALPIYYEFQLRYYLAVMDQDVGDFACLWGNNPNNDMATPRLLRDKFKEDLIFEKLDQWIWSLRNDKPPTMADVNPSLAMEALARIYGASNPALPTIEFSTKQEHALRRIALLQAENAEHKGIINSNEKEIEAHSVRIAEIMKEHEHGILEMAADKLLIDFVTKTTRRVSSDLLKKNHPTVYQECLKPSESRKIKVTVEPVAI